MVTDLTWDHKPSIPSERERIEKAGGRVFSMEYDDGYDGPMRVWLADQDVPGLAMSRSICDTVAHSVGRSGERRRAVGVISSPDVFERDLTDDDRVLVMGSDGLWEFISSQEVIELIEDCEQPDVAVVREVKCRKRLNGFVLLHGNAGLMRRRWWTIQRSLLFF